MLLMVTNRRLSRDEYGDEEQANFGKHYLFDYQPDQHTFNDRGQRGFRAALLREMTRLRDEVGVNTPKIGIYLHGFNNDYKDSVDELSDLENALAPIIGYAPILVGFSWPSSGTARAYLSDREEVRDSIPAFTRFLNDISGFLIANERNCFCTSYCIAHSMGNYLLRKGFEYLSDHLGTPVSRAMFNETILLAPDISANDIELNGKGRYIADFSRRVHVYYSRHDRALKLSSKKRFGANRLGRHGADDYENVATNVIFVNSERFANSDSADELQDGRGKSVSVHSSYRYSPDILADIVQVMSSVDRNLITTRTAVRKVPEDPLIQDNHFEFIAPE